MIAQNNGVLTVQGSMTIPFAAALLSEGRRLVTEADQQLDLSAVTEVDSSALAVVLDWVRTARRAGKTLKITNSPPIFNTLTSLYGVEELFANGSHQ